MIKQVKKDIKLWTVFNKLKDDITNLSEELEDLKHEIRERDEKHITSSRKFLRFLKDSHIKLTRMKPKLFEKNLTVHKVLGDVSGDEMEVRYLEVDKLRDEVVDLYQIWDSCMNLVSQHLLRAEESEKSVRDLESGLVGLSSFLRKESKKLLVNVTDSGLSTASESSQLQLDQKISEQETRLDSLRTGVVKLRGERREGAKLERVNSALVESRRQLDQLKSILSSTRSSHLPPLARRRRRLLSFWRLGTCLLCLVMVLVVVIPRPRCCDYSSPAYTMLQYTGGPRPI